MAHMGANLYAHVTGALGNEEKAEIDETTSGCRGLFVAGWREAENGEGIVHSTRIYGAMCREAFKAMLKSMVRLVGRRELLRIALWTLIHGDRGLTIKRDERWKGGESDD